MRIYDYTFAAKLSANSLYNEFPYIRIGTVASRLTVDPSFLDLFLDLWSDLRFVSYDIAADALPWLCMTYPITLERTGVISLAAAERSPLQKILPYCRRLHVWLREENESPVLPCRPARRETRLSSSEWLQVCHQLPSTSLVLGLAGFDSEGSAAKALEPLKKLSLSQVGISQHYNSSDLNTIKVIKAFFMHMIEKELLARGGSFRFLDLPMELRQRVLRYTDLLAPFREVIRKQNRFALYPRASSRCRKQKRELCCREGLVYPPCTCYRSPISIFLVCRTMSEDARQVFYSSNRFVLVPDLPPKDAPNAGDYITLLTDTRLFLSRALSLHSLHHLRDLEIFFHYRTYANITEDSTNERAVNQVVGLLAQDMGRLSLTVHLDPHQESAYTDSDRRDLSISQEIQFAAQSRFVTLLQPLRRLTSFFVKIGLLDTETRQMDEVLLRKHDQERRLEQLVMGESYDALRHGKSQRRPSLWETADSCCDYNSQIDGHLC
jgi:hypothetical protein